MSNLFLVFPLGLQEKLGSPVELFFALFLLVLSYLNQIVGKKVPFSFRSTGEPRLGGSVTSCLHPLGTSCPQQVLWTPEELLILFITITLMCPKILSKPVGSAQAPSHEGAALYTAASSASQDSGVWTPVTNWRAVRIHRKSYRI